MQQQGGQQSWGGQPYGQPGPPGSRPPGGFQPGPPGQPQQQQQPQYGMQPPPAGGMRPAGPPMPGQAPPQQNGMPAPGGPRPFAPTGGPPMPGGPRPGMPPPAGAYPPGQGPRPGGMPGAPQASMYGAPTPAPQGPRPAGPPAAMPGAGGMPQQRPMAPVGQAPRPMMGAPQGYGAAPPGQPPAAAAYGAPRPPSPQPQFGAPIPGGPRPLGAPVAAPGPAAPIPAYGMRPPGQMQGQMQGPPGAQQPFGVPAPQQGMGGMRPPGPPMPGAAMPMPQQQQQQQQQPGGMMPGQFRPAAPGAFAPPIPGGGFGAPPPQSPGGPGAYAPRPGPPPPPGMGAPHMAPPPPMGGMQMPGYDTAAMTSTALDAFETLSLGPGGPPGMPGGGAGGGPPNAAAFPRPAGTAEQQNEAAGPPTPYTSSNCSPTFVRLTSQAAPNSQALKARWHLPYGAIVHPLAEADGPVPVANANNANIVRCKRCRTYMNPFMVWMDGGRRFTCNVCQMVNETPVDYFCSLDASGRRLDHNQRPEICSGSVEYVAPAEYMVRAPMPPTYVFLLDVSFPAVASGMLATACAAIKECLGRLPGEDRTRVAVMTFDNSIHFYNLRAGLAAPQMMVVPEIDEPFVPLPDELLVNLSECRPLVERLLDSIPASFAHTQRVDSAMGPALQAAFLVMNHIGGKLLLFQAATPSLGIGRVKARDNPALYGTDREYALRSPDDPFYKRFSAEASRFQICVDVFACGSAYQDLPSLGALPKYTGGQCYYYPGFSADKDSVKLTAEVTRNLTRETAWESVMRIRCSKGLRVSSFYGHFFVRSTDLLALPACDADKAFSVEISHEETVLTGSTAYLQAALLFTSSNGERRIRVHTLAIPVVSDLLDLYKVSDAGATAALLAKVSVERSMSAKLDDVRAGVQQRLAASLREYRMLHMRGPPGAGPQPSSLVLPERLKSLPVLTLGLLKTAALRGSGRDVNTDERAAVGHQVTTDSVNSLLRLIYPSCYRVDDQSGGWGRPRSADGAGSGNNIELPPTAPAGLEYFDPSGAYLIDNGRVMVLWLGSATPQQFYTAVFGAGAQDPATMRVEPPQQGSELSARICAVVSQLRSARELFQEVHVVRQGTPMEAHVMPYFIEDKMGAGGSLPGYLEYMMMVQKSVMAKQ